jgi:hypothetical protein
VSLWGVWEGKPDPLGELAIKIIRFNKHVKEVLGLGLGYLPGSAELKTFLRSVDRDPPYDVTPRSPIAGIYQSNVNSLLKLTEYVDPKLDLRPHLFALLENRKVRSETSIPLHVRALKQAYFGDLCSISSDELWQILSELRRDFDKNWSGYKVMTMPNPHILLGDDWIS